MPDVASLRLGQQFRLDRGLDTVLDDAGAQPSLPDRRWALPPAELRAYEALDDLLAARNLQQLMSEALRPRIQDPGLLLPARFAAALAQARQALGAQESLRSPDAARRRRRLRKAIEVLDEQEELRGLLWTYRNALQQG